MVILACRRRQLVLGWDILFNRAKNKIVPIYKKIVIWQTNTYLIT